MKRLVRCVCPAILAVCSIPSLAYDSPWSGTWKMDPGKSKLTGQTFTYTAAGGKFHYADGTFQYEFSCDGKQYPTIADRSLVCTGSMEAGYDFAYSANGKVLSKSHVSFSSDGKTMTEKGVSMHPDGTTSNYAEIDTRESGTTGMAGKWKSSKVDTSASVIKVEVSGNTMHLENSRSKTVVDAKLDGTFVPVSGPTVPPGAMESYKAEGASKMRFSGKVNDKVFFEGVQTISADGKTMTIESWSPGKMAEKTTEVWEKQ